MKKNTEEIESRLVDAVVKYTDAAQRLRKAAMEESVARSSSSSPVIILGLASERARLEMLACQAEAWLFTLSDMLLQAREREEEAADETGEE